MHSKCTQTLCSWGWRINWRSCGQFPAWEQRSDEEAHRVSKNPEIQATTWEVTRAMMKAEIREEISGHFWKQKSSARNAISSRNGTWQNSVWDYSRALGKAPLFKNRYFGFAQSNNSNLGWIIWGQSLNHICLCFLNGTCTISCALQLTSGWKLKNNSRKALCIPWRMDIIIIH